MEDEIVSHEQQLQDVMQIGEDLIAANHFGSDRIRDRITEVNNMWEHLKELQSMRKQRLYDAVDYHQVKIFHVYIVISKCFHFRNRSKILVPF